MLTRVFQSGNSIAVRIPKELAIVEASQDVLIERAGNTLVIRPVPLRLLAGIAEIFAEFSVRVHGGRAQIPQGNRTPRLGAARLGASRIDGWIACWIACWIVC